MTIAAHPAPQNGEEGSGELGVRFGDRFCRRDRIMLFAVGTLLPAAVLPPFAFVLFPTLPSRFESRAIANGLVLLLLLLPFTAGLAAARIGLRRIVQTWRDGREGDFAFHLWRICVGPMLFAYGVALTLGDGGPAPDPLGVPPPVSYLAG